ncbi:PREDICTED: kelch domain-containing protein 4 [Rhagoletis zephyria]|uniref:kelch domain-containing protein 4 n=1 Tax=Rhagoletis zephyria TaxID=28612 RepID=UPI000811902B|nr:PREDICTED: kelch domain-containing protein 4 [Rhagoletis zephyria]XP_017480472.1 PREDICTED: kelch domain-containing protein 4 [Rhagoletis zephyria]
MGKKDKNKKKGKGAEKTAMKTDKKLAAKQKRMLEKLGEADIAEVVSKLEAEEARRKTVTEELCSPPAPRSNFTFVAHPEKEELILFGGEFYNGQRVCVYNDLFFYNIAKNEWKQVRAPAGPAPRSGHQMVAVAADGGQLWVFGGEHASPSQMQFYHYKDLWVMRLKTRTWEKVNAQNGPSARSGHRMVANKKRLFIFGGFHDNNQSYRYFNDVHIFSLESYEWLKIEISGAIIPAPRSGCCMAACPDGKVLIWGGYSKAAVKKDADRGIVHTDMFSIVPDKSCTNEKFKWVTVKAGGYRPLPRSSVSCTTAPNGKAYCFGGVMDIDEDEEDIKGQFGEDLLALDLNAQTWRLLEIAKKERKVGKKQDDMSLQDVEMESSTNMPETISTDGVFTVTVAGRSGSSCNTSLPKVPSLFPNRRPKNLPSPRMNSGLCVCKGTLYVYGGLYEEDNKQYTFNDFYALDLHKLDEWKAIIPNDMNAHEWVDSESSDSGDDDDTESDSESDDDADGGMETD